MYKIYNLSEICMLCLAQQNLQSMLKVDPDGFKIIDKLRTFLGQPIHFEQNIPQNICNNCLVNLNYIHSFRLICLENIREISKHVNCLQTKNKEFKKITVVTVTSTKCEDPLQLGNQNNSGTYYNNQDDMNTNFQERIIAVNSVLFDEKSMEEEKKAKSLEEVITIDDKEDEDPLNTSQISYEGFKDDEKMIIDITYSPDGKETQENIKIDQNNTLNTCQSSYDVFKEINEEINISDTLNSTVDGSKKEIEETQRKNIKMEHVNLLNNCQTSYDVFKEFNEEININDPLNSPEGDSRKENEATQEKCIKIEHVNSLNTYRTSYDVFKEFNEEINITETLDLPEDDGKKENEEKCTKKNIKIEQINNLNTCQTSHNVFKEFNEESNIIYTTNSPKDDCTIENKETQEECMKKVKIEYDHTSNSCQTLSQDVVEEFNAEKNIIDKTSGPTKRKRLPRYKPQYQCDGCSKTYTLFSCLQKHRLRHDFLKNVKLIKK